MGKGGGRGVRINFTRTIEWHPWEWSPALSSWVSFCFVWFCRLFEFPGTEPVLSRCPPAFANNAPFLQGQRKAFAALLQGAFMLGTLEVQAIAVVSRSGCLRDVGWWSPKIKKKGGVRSKMRRKLSGGSLTRLDIPCRVLEGQPFEGDVTQIAIQEWAWKATLLYWPSTIGLNIPERYLWQLLRTSTKEGQDNPVQHLECKFS